MSLVCRRKSGRVLELSVARSTGTYVISAACFVLSLYLLRETYRSYDSRAALVWSFSREALLGSLLSLFVGYFSLRGEPEVCLIDKEAQTMQLQKYMPFRATRILVAPPLQLLAGVSIEGEPTKPRYKRIVFEFETGQTIPVTDSFFDTTAGVFSKAGAGLPEAKREIKQFLNMDLQSSSDEEEEADIVAEMQTTAQVEKKEE